MRHTCLALALLAASCALVIADANENDLPILSTIKVDVTIAGYRLGTNAIGQSRIDLDVGNMSAAASLTAATNVYRNGGSSMFMGELETLQGLSADTGTGDTFPTLSKYITYYNNDQLYADTFVSAALEGTGSYAASSAAYRQAVAVAGATYLTMWMQPQHELNDQLNICLQGGNFNTPEDVSCWDEAWAYMAGSLVGPDGTGAGQLLYSLSAKMSAEFATASPTTTTANQKLLALWSAGQTAARMLDCVTMALNRDAIAVQMTLPLVQGVLSFAYKADPKILCHACTTPERSFESANLWALVSAVLPQVQACDASVAALLVSNTSPDQFNAGNMLPAGVAAITKALQSTYSCLGLTCAAVGGNSNVPACVDASTAPPSSSCSQPTNVAAIVLGVLLGLTFLILLLVSVTKFRQTIKHHDAANGYVGDDLAKPKHDVSLA